jgi:hypothetical protein
MSFFINKIDQVKKMFFNEDTSEPEKNIKKTPNTIEINTDYDLEKTHTNKENFSHIPTNKFTQHTLSNFHDVDGIDEDYNDADYEEEEEENIYDSAPYTFKNLYSEQVSEYYYINDRLNRNFGSCMDFDSTKYQIHFCIFKINEQCHFKGSKIPFLEFVFEKKNNVFAFPSIEFNCPHKQTIDDDLNKEPVEEDDDDVYFKNECIKKLLDIFELEQIDESLMEKMYKGFLEFDENNIFVVFDFTYIPSYYFKTEEKQSFLFFSSTVDKYEWGIIDEIRKKEIQKTPIENLVVNFFQKYRYMNEIKTYNRTLLPVPSSLYLCKYENGSYKNITENLHTNYEKRSEHPYLGFFYFFSQTGSKRYAVFSENNIVFDRTFEKMKEMDSNEYNSILLNKSVFEYVENNQSIWCIKPDSLFCEL